MPSIPPQTSIPQSYLEQNIGNHLTNTAIAFIVIDTVFVGLRIWARRFSKSAFGWDDLLVVLGLVFCIGTAVTCIIDVQYGGVGYHIVAVSPTKIPLFMKCTFIAGPVQYSIAATLPKLAILALYLKIFRAKYSRVGCYITGAVLILTCVVNIPTLIWQCSPLSYLWEQYASTSIQGHCFNSRAHFLYGSLPNIVTDVAMLLLPIPTLWKLQSSMKVKIGVFLTFLTGSVGLITSIIRFVVFFNPEDDPTWDAVILLIWIIVEPSVYIIAACLIACRPLASYLIYEKLISTLFSTSRTAAKSSKNQNSVRMAHRSREGPAIELGSNDGHSDRKILVSDKGDVRVGPCSSGIKTPQSVRFTVIVRLGHFCSKFTIAIDNKAFQRSRDMEETIGSEAKENSRFITGGRLLLSTLSISLCMLVVNIEVTVVSTSLTSITNDLQGFSKTGWILTGYLITYASTLIIWSKVSDAFGRKPSILAAVIIFTAFSGGCGAAQSMNQLIICRVFQGIGAAGCVAMSLVIAYEMVPLNKYPTYAALLSAMTAIGSLTGPLIGGIVSERSTWRWVFLLNVPAGVMILVLILSSIPANFPHQGDASYIPLSLKQKFSRNSLLKIDLIGVPLLLGASLLLVTVLLEGGTQFAWNSATSISLFVISALLWSLFMVNERIITSETRLPEPIFPWRFLFNREWMGVLTLSLLSGIPYNVVTIDIPQRFLAVDGVSPFGAGLRLIPYNFLISLGSVLVNVVAAKFKILPIYLLLIGSVLQLVGVTLLSTIRGETLFAAMYVYEALTGFGVGMIFGICLVIPPRVVEKRDIAISSGALLQSRVFGGAIGLAITSSVMSNYLTSHLEGVVSAEQFKTLLQSTAAIRTFPADIQLKVLAVFSEGYRVQMQILIGFAGAQILAVGMLWRKPQIALVQPNGDTEPIPTIESKEVLPEDQPVGDASEGTSEKSEGIFSEGIKQTES
ncbi:hypothetical protein G7Y89_g1666 [Cudoniella acicularis]|uniref:Major facilitator superfamily (MFS) profile domain-containing protein n=1 Tax=Cudoniella acicularis TaxID=354080 RepID=A0A8H4RWI1_9HELO|nr:hypothetical protein G7Y89_g1666 [Cudoniella acicularis]